MAVNTSAVSLTSILCALISGISWNLLTWWFGLPSSSSHALIGGLCGAALATAHGDWSVIRWSVLNPSSGKWEGLWPKVVKPMIVAPECGLVAGFVVMGLLMLFLLRSNPRRVDTVFARLQLLSAAWMSFSHGTNDAQKIHGFAAQSTAAAIIQIASHWGMPLSTTHVISTSIMGVGTAKRFNAVKWSVVERMAWAWIMTLPITAFIGYALLQTFRLLGWGGWGPS